MIKTCSLTIMLGKRGNGIVQAIYNIFRPIQCHGEPERVLADTDW